MLGMAELPVVRRDRSVRAYALIDDADLERLSVWHWYLDARGYVVRREGTPSAGTGITYYLHRAVLGLGHGDPRLGDHINRNRLDNRQQNLRVVSRTENPQNVGANCGGSSAYRGVSWNAARGKWAAFGNVDRRQKHLGLFTTEEAAAAAAAAWRRENVPFAVEA